MLTKASNILINIERNEIDDVKWNGKDVVITDYQIFKQDRVSGTPGWAPSEQWLRQFKR